MLPGIKDVGISYEADPKHSRTIITKTGADSMKPVSTPMTKEAGETDKTKEEDITKRKKEGRLCEKEKPGDLELLSPADCTLYRGLAATLNYLAADRGDFAHAAKECAREMATPTCRSWERMVRVGRYLKGRPRVRIWYKYQSMPEGFNNLQ